MSSFRYHPGLCCLRRLIGRAVRQRAASNREPPPRMGKRNDVPSELLPHSACCPGSIAAGAHSTHSNCGNLTGSSRNIHSDHAHLGRIDEHDLIIHLSELVGLCFRVGGEDVVR